MKRIFSSYLKLLHANRVKRRRTACILTAMSVLVTGEVFWQLRSTGTAMQDSSAPVHIHSPACYETVYICGEPPDHVHTDSCAEQRLICGESAGEQAGICTESPEIWEATLPDNLPECRAERTARIAESQLGYEAQQGYSRYGEWYGLPYCQWNTAFAAFCLHYSGVEGYEVPFSAGCPAWAAALENAHLLLNTDDGAPKRGDILFMDTDSNGEPDRTGIVTGIEDSDEGTFIELIEGDTNGSVAKRQYLPGELTITGWLTPPEPEVLTAETHPLPETLSFQAESDTGILVCAKADYGIFPEGTEMHVTDVPDELALAAASEALGQAERTCTAVDISFYDAEGTELQPADHSAVRVQITLPAEKMPESGFTVLHVPDEGAPETVEQAELTEDGITFLAESFSIYVLVQEEPEHHSQVIETSYPNDANNPYVIYVGDKLYVAGSGNFAVYNNGPDNNKILDRTSDGGNTAYSLSDGSNGIRAGYYARRPGTVELKSGNDSFYVEVREPKIMVKAEHGYKEKDRIREYLGPSEKYPTDFQLVNQDGYVPNAINRPYLLNVGERLEIYSYSSDSGRKFWDESYYVRYKQGDESVILQSYPISYTNPNIDQYRSLKNIVIWDAENQPWDDDRKAWDTREWDEEAGMWKYTDRFEAIKPGLTCIHFAGYEGTDEQVMWVKVLDNPKFTHADMEIADGGTYSQVTIRYQDGHKYTDVSVYNAYVSAVNYAIIYDKNNTQLTRFSSEDGDYEFIGQQNSTQYELSSAYICTLDGSKSPKHYDSQAADHARFDVQLTLQPNATYSLDESGQIVPGSIQTMTGENQIVESAIFDLNHAAVLDAKNKCPLGNGLDFTVRAQSALLQIEADKTLTGRKLTDKEFQFELFDADNNNAVISSAYNDEQGNISFENLHFDDEGIYHYKMRELIPEEPDESLLYTTEEFDLTVEVKRSVVTVNGQTMEILYAEVDSEAPNFINHVKYKLPATGGEGIWFCLFAGTALIASAFILLCISRKRTRRASTDKI